MQALSASSPPPNYTPTIEDASNYRLHSQHTPQYPTQSQNHPTRTPLTATNTFSGDPLTTWNVASYTGHPLASHPSATIAGQDYQHQPSPISSASYTIPLPQQASMSPVPLNSMHTPKRLSPSATPSGVQLPYYDQEGLQAVPPYASYTVSIPHQPVRGPVQMASVYSPAQYSQYMLQMENQAPWSRGEDIADMQSQGNTQSSVIDGEVSTGIRQLGSSDPLYLPQLSLGGRWTW